MSELEDIGPEGQTGEDEAFLDFFPHVARQYERVFAVVDPQHERGVVEIIRLLADRGMKDPDAELSDLESIALLPYVVRDPPRFCGPDQAEKGGIIREEP